MFVDDGVSGAARSRPALDELRGSIRRRQTDVVVVAKLDRLGRTVRGLVEWMSEWDDEGVALGVGFRSVRLVVAGRTDAEESARDVRRVRT